MLQQQRSHKLHWLKEEDYLELGSGYSEAGNTVLIPGAVTQAVKKAQKGSDFQKIFLFI